MKHPSANENRTSATTPAESRTDKFLRSAIRLVDAGHPDRALTELGRAKINTDPIRNARGVCLMRLGRIEEALRLFRSLVLTPGGTWMKPGLPVFYYTNFCTVLLLAGHPAGCLDSLREIAEQDHPSVMRLRHCLDCWQRGLNGWAWLTWKLGAEPKVPITLEFAPGEFEGPPTAPDTTPPLQHPLDRAA